MKTFLFILMFPCLAHSGPYYEVKNSTITGTSTMTISGYIGVAASSVTYTTYTFVINGVEGYLQFPDGTRQTAAANSFSISTATYALSTSTVFAGDVTGTYQSLAVGNDSHTHGDASITDLAASKLTGALPAIDGSALTGLNLTGDNLGNHTATQLLVAHYAIHTTTITADNIFVASVTATGNVTAPAFIGDGSQITGIKTSNITGITDYLKTAVFGTITVTNLKVYNAE